MKRTMSQDGVGTQCDIHVEFNIVSRGHRSDMVKNLFGPFTPTEFFGVAINYRAGVANWRGRVKLVRLEYDLDRFRKTFLTEHF
jgi:hypothetical protein